MEGNYSGANKESHGQHNSIIYSTQSTSLTGLCSTSVKIDSLGSWCKDQEEIDEKVVAKTLNELDADILLAMENLSITDEDIKSSTSGDQSIQNSVESNGNILFRFSQFFWWVKNLALDCL